MRAKGFQEAAIFAALWETNQAQCQPPLTEAEVHKIAGSACRYEAGPSTQEQQQHRNGDTPGPPFDLAAFLAKLQSTEPADRLQSVLTAIDALATVPLAAWVATKHTLKTQVPELNLNDLERLRSDARQEAQRQAAKAARADLPAWQQSLFLSKEGDVQETDNNLQAIFAHHAFWQGRLWWDVVANRAYLDEGQRLDIHYVRNEVAPWLGTTLRMPIRHSPRVLEVMRSWAQRQPRDPIQEWLATLPDRDDTDLKRNLLNTFLHTYAGAEDTPYTRFISRILIVSLVQRALHPGIQYRYVVVLEGEEDLGKTQLLRRLGDRWHQEFPKTVEGKEAYMQLQGYWLVELGELDALKPAQETRIKMFISQQMDIWVPKYENDNIERPRRCILVGTTNEREYLKGEHGNTRYLPLWLDGPIQLDQIAAVRDRLFTQAKAFLAAHPDDWWMIPDDVEDELLQEREKRREPSVFEEALRPLLHGRKRCSSGELLEMLQIPHAQWTKRLEMDIAKAMKGLKWYRHVEWDRELKKSIRFWADTPPGKKEVPF
jgi:predicted P-loop ATPase